MSSAEQFGGDPALQDGGEVRRRALVGIVSVGLRGVAIRLFGLMGYFVAARLLVPADFGLAAVGLTITFAAHFLADGGIGPSLLRAREEPQREDYAAVVGVQVAVLSVFAAAFVFWAIVSGSKTAIVTALFVASLPMLSFRLPAGIALERDLTYGPSIRSDLAEVLAYNVWIIVGAASGFGVYALATGAIAKTIVGTVVLNHYAPVGWIRPSLDVQRIRKFLRFGMTFQATSAVSLVRDQMINFGTAAIAGYGVLGFWAIAARVSSVPYLLFESLGRVSFPTMARLQALGEDLVGPMERQTRRSTVLSGIVLAPSAVAGTALLPLVLGSKWDEATVVLPYLFFGVMVSQPVSVVASGFLLAVGDATAILRTATAILITQVVLTAILLPTIGYVGMGVAQLFAAVIDGVVLAHAVHGHNGARLLRCTLPGTFAFVPAVVLGLVVAGDQPGLLLAIAGTALALGVFVAIAFMVDRSSVTGLARMIREAPARMRSAPEAVVLPMS